MRHRWAFVLLLAGCAETAASVDAGVADGGPRAGDAAPGDDAAIASDAGPPIDAGPRPDSGTSPEECTGGVDEDGDTLVDCDDDACWEEPECAANHVARMHPGLTACHDPIERTAAQSDADCARLGTPDMSTYATECAGEIDLESTIRFFCDADGVAAAWVLERLTLPRHSRMISMRVFESQDYEHTSVIDWERTAFGAGSSSGPGPYPTLSTYGESTWIVTVRTVEPGASIDRLIGLTQITSVIDLDMPMSRDTRRTFRTGATSFTVPR